MSDLCRQKMARLFPLSNQMIFNHINNRDTRSRRDLIKANINPIFTAASGNDVNVFRDMLGMNIDINITDMYGNTLLHHAAMGGNEEIVDVLLDNAGFDPYTVNDEGIKPIFYAASCNHLGVFNKLSRFSIQSADKHENTILHYAAIGGTEKIVQTVLQEYQYNFNVCNHEQIKPVYYAASRGHLEVFEKLFEFEDRESCKEDIYGNTICHYAIVGGDSRIAHIAINDCDNPELANNEGITPIFLAASRGHLDMFRELSNCRVDWNDTDKNGNTVLHAAARGGNAGIVKIALQHCGKHSDTYFNDEGCNPLFLAASRGHLYAFSVLSSYLPFISKWYLSDKNGNTLLHHAAMGGNTEIINEVLHHCGNPEPSNIEGVTPVLLAASKGHLYVFRVLTKLRIDWDSADKHGNTILHHAAIGGNIKILKIILQKCPNSSPANDEGITPMFLAAFKGHFNVFRELAKSCNDWDMTDKYGNTVLHHAAIGGNTKILKILQKYFDNTDAVSKEGITPIFLAASRGHLDMFRELSNCRVDWNDTDKNGNTVLHAAAMGGNAGIVKIALQHCGKHSDTYFNDEGCNPLFLAASRGHLYAFSVLSLPLILIWNLSDKNGNTLLHHAAMGGNTVIINEVLHLCGNPEPSNIEGVTPVFLAASRGHLYVFREFVKSCPNWDATDKHGNTILHHAAIGGNIKILKIILQKCPNSSPANDEGITPLFLAASKGYLDVFRELAKFCIDWDVADKNGNTVLHHAAIGGNTEILKILQKYFHNTDAVNKEGITPIFLAASWGHLDMFRELAKFPIDRNGTDKNGNTVLHHAAIGGNGEIVNISRRYCDNPDAANNGGITPIFLAASRGHFDVFREFAKPSIDWYVTDKTGNTVLHHAAIGGNIEIMKFSVKYCNNINAENNEGITPIFLAASRGHLDMFRELAKFPIIDWKVTDKNGNRVWHHAVMGGNAELVRISLDYCYNSDTYFNNEGCNPIILAASRGHFDVFYELVENDPRCDGPFPNWDATDKYGNTVLHHAAIGGNLRILRIILEKCLNRGPFNHEGITPMFLGASRGHLHVFREFVDKFRIDWNMADKYGNTVLHHAAIGGNIEIMKISLNRCGNRNPANREGITPMQLAASKGHNDIIREFEKFQIA